MDKSKRAALQNITIRNTLKGTAVNAKPLRHHVHNFGGALPYVVCGRDGNVALFKVGYRGMWVPKRFKTIEAAERAALAYEAQEGNTDGH